MNRAVLKTNEATATQSGAMEARDHFKNGAGSKSQTSRGNFLRKTMKKIVCISVLLLIAAGIIRAQEIIIFEKGLPKTIVAYKKSYKIEKCKMTSVGGLIKIQIYGEGLGFVSVDKKGRYPIKCYFDSNGRRYHPYMSSTEDDSNIFLFTMPPMPPIPEPETIVFHASDNAKKQKIEIRCK